MSWLHCGACGKWPAYVFGAGTLRCEGCAEADKLALYRAGKYSFPVPPVTHDQWSEQNWIDYIDNHGRWHNG